MRFQTTALLLACAAPLTLTPFSAGAAQQADFRWEKQLAADKVVSLHNLSGRISVTPSTTGRVEIVGTRRGRGRTDDEVTIEIVEHDRGITACTMYKNLDMECHDGGFQIHSRGRRNSRDYDDNAYMDMEVRVPKGMRVTANSVSGDVRVSGMEGVVRAGSVSGDVRMEQLKATSVRASSVSGDVDVIIDNLTGDGMLNFSSVSGNVTVELPKGLDADVSMRSVSGSLDSDFPLTLNGRVSRSSINARIGKGGRELDVHTVSGDVRLRMGKQ
jgi:hypothetical protein